MSASPFRSHLLQQWARSSQGRAPAAVVPWLNKSSSSHKKCPARYDSDIDADECRTTNKNFRHQKGDDSWASSISTLDSSPSFQISNVPSALGRSTSAEAKSPTNPKSRRYSTFRTSTMAPANGSTAEGNTSKSGRKIDRLKREIHSTHAAGLAAAEAESTAILEGCERRSQTCGAGTEIATTVQSVLRERRTASRFKEMDSDDRSFEERERSLRDALFRAVKCAQMAPNHKRTEPFSFRRFLAGSQAAAKLADISYQVAFRKKGSHPSAESKRKKWLDIPAFLVAVVHDNQGPQSTESITGDDMYKALPYSHPDTERQLEDYAAASAAVQNVLLSLHAEGIGSKWATGPVIKTPAFRDLVQASSTDRVAGLIMIGGTTEFGTEREAQKMAARRRRRRPIEGDLMVDLE